MKVWVPRDEPPDGPLSTALRARGFTVILEPVVQRQLRASPAEILVGLTANDWLVLTSPFAIEAVADVAEARVPRVAVVGESSRQLAAHVGLRVELVGPDGHGNTMFAQLRTLARDCVVCYPRSALAREPESWPTIKLRCPVLYDTVTRPFDRERVKSAEIVAVAARSQVRAIDDLDIPMASIGRATSAAIRATGREPVVEAAYPTFDNLAAAIATHLTT